LVGKGDCLNLADDSFSSGAGVTYFLARPGKAKSNALRSAQVRRISWVLQGSAGLGAVRVASS
jgi:hypothetical protein